MHIYSHTKFELSILIRSRRMKGFQKSKIVSWCWDMEPPITCACDSCQIVHKIIHILIKPETILFKVGLLKKWTHHEEHFYSARSYSFADYCKARFDVLHAAGYNSAQSEPIWVKFGTLWAKCWGLAMGDFGCDPSSSDSLRGSRSPKPIPAPTSWHSWPIQALWIRPCVPRIPDRCTPLYRGCAWVPLSLPYHSFLLPVLLCARA